MKKKPIIFSTAMVKAIIAGNKTQTRRIIKKVKDVYGHEHNIDDAEIDIDKTGAHIYSKFKNKMFSGYTICPYKIGQILWIRETFTDTWGDDIIYKADGGSAVEAGYSREPRWKPSIFMPRRAARLFLKVTNIKVERVQDIKLSDMLKEGLKAYSFHPDEGDSESDIANRWIELWDSINKKRGYGWEINPLVWVYDFEVINNYGSDKE